MNETTNEKPSDRSQLSLWVRLKYSVIRSALQAIAKLFGLNGLYVFGQCFAFCEYFLQYKRRARISRRLDQIYDEPLPKRKKHRIMRQFFTRVRCDKMIYTIIDLIDRDELLSRFEIVGKEYLDAGNKRGKGTLFLFSHQGSHHVGGIFMALAGYPLVGIRDPKESVLRRYVQDKFERCFPEFKDFQVTSNDISPRTFFRQFAANHLVASAMDATRNRGQNVRTVTVNAFGGKMEVISGMTHIALRCKAAILVGFFISLPKYRYQMVYSPWLCDPDTAVDNDETVQNVMQQYADLIQNHVRTRPDQISKTR